MIMNCKNEWRLQKEIINSIISYFIELNPEYTREECYIAILSYVRSDNRTKYYEIGQTLVDLYIGNIKF